MLLLLQHISLTAAVVGWNRADFYLFYAGNKYRNRIVFVMESSKKLIKNKMHNYLIWDLDSIIDCVVRMGVPIFTN